MKVRLRRVFCGIMLTHAFGITIFIVANSGYLIIGSGYIRDNTRDAKLVVLNQKHSFIDGVKLDSMDVDGTKRDAAKIAVKTENGPIINVTAKECNNVTIGRPVGNLFGTVEDWWQPLDSDKRMHFFSAYLDKAGQHIRVIGLKIRKQFSVVCQLWYSGASVVEVAHSVANVIQLADGSRRYAASITSCPLPDSRVPTSISLVPEKCSTPQNLMTIRNTAPTAEVFYQFTVCISPLNFRYSRAYELVEWIELNRILGAEHFMFYNYSTGANVDDVLFMYMKRGLVSVVQWDLPMSVDKWPPTNEEIEVYYFAQTAAINDCLMRNRLTSKYIVYMDVDEFIIPHKNGSYTWSDILKDQPYRAAYTFQSSFFRKEWNDTTVQHAGKDLAIRYRLVTLLKLQRENMIFRPRERTKYIVRPSLVETVEVHDISRYSTGQSGFNVAPDTALVHHYRIWIDAASKVPRKPDDTALKYASELIANVDSVWSQLPEVEMDRPIV